ncbi:MAG TPA: hypothetical protein GXX51_09030 [Firmicutes bacterium]|nr:hypothetical protein [Bacillota bacterium]
MAGFLSGLFGGKKGTKKYEDIFTTAKKMGQSIEYAFRQAVDASVADKVFKDKSEACDKLLEVLLPKVDSELHPALRKACERIKEL